MSPMDLDTRTTNPYDLNALRTLMGERDLTPRLPAWIRDDRQSLGDERFRIKVTTGAILFGSPRQPQDCPVAIAVRRSVSTDRSVEIETTTFTTHFHGPGPRCVQYLHEPDLALAIMRYDTGGVWKAPVGRDYEMVRFDLVTPEITTRWMRESRSRHLNSMMSSLAYPYAFFGTP